MSSCPVGPLNARIKEGIVGNGVAVTVSSHITESPYSSCTHTFGYPTFRGSKRGIHYGRIRLPDAAGGPSNPQGHLDPRLGQPAGTASRRRVLPNAVYRIDPSGRIDRVLR